MPISQAALRAVAPDEKPAATRTTRTRTKTVAQAAASGTERELLVALRSRIAKSVDDLKTPARDLAALICRLQEITAEIKAIDNAGKPDGEGEADAAPDEVTDGAFDPSTF